MFCDKFQMKKRKAFCNATPLEQLQQIVGFIQGRVT